MKVIYTNITSPAYYYGSHGIFYKMYDIITAMCNLKLRTPDAATTITRPSECKKKSAYNHAAVRLQPSMCQRNPAYDQLGAVDGSQAALVSGSYSENLAYGINAQLRSHQEPTYEVIPSDANGILRTVQGTQNIDYNQNPA